MLPNGFAEFLHAWPFLKVVAIPFAFVTPWKWRFSVDKGQPIKKTETQQINVLYSRIAYHRALIFAKLTKIDALLSIYRIRIRIVPDVTKN